ncbi:thermonuclease family protein [Candidatus Uhrbacteria bacterium]|nr:thermonuclease family protein [Candidatus Uhrbacteria bacterium]
MRIFQNKISAGQSAAILGLIILLLIFLITFVVIAAGDEKEAQQTIPPPVTAEPQKQEEQTPKQDAPPIQPFLPTVEQIPAPEVKDETVLVTRVIDGDTIEIEGGQRVRYIGIDTPETVDPRKPVQCFGAEASNYNKALVENKRVRLEKDVSETDKYGRLLRYVYVDNLFVNLVLIQEGFAHSSAYPPDVKYQPQFTAAERLAREQQKGLWNSCPAAPIAPPPAAAAPGAPPLQSPLAACTIKGNVTTEKIYHLEGCGSYEKTKIDEARGERWFCTEAEAAAAGWRKAQNCP